MATAETEVLEGHKGSLVHGASGINDVRDWSFAMAGNNKEYSGSSTPKHKKTSEGVKSGKLSWNMYFATVEDVFVRLKIGQLTTLIANLDTDAAKFFSIPCRIESMDVKEPIEEGDPVEVSCEATAHGAWVYPNGDVSGA